MMFHARNIILEIRYNENVCFLGRTDKPSIRLACVHLNYAYHIGLYKIFILSYFQNKTNKISIPYIGPCAYIWVYVTGVSFFMYIILFFFYYDLTLYCCRPTDFRVLTFRMRCITKSVVAQRTDRLKIILSSVRIRETSRIYIQRTGQYQRFYV